MAYDKTRDRVVLFGGRIGLQGLLIGDTWEWDGVNWTQRSPANSPPPTARGGAMVYDEARGEVVQFGGDVGSSNYVATTWTWDGTDWTLRQPVNRPAPRVEFAFAYDSDRQVAVLYGGQTPLLVATDDTWEWDGTNWTQRFPTVRPPPLVSVRMAYDRARRRMVAFSGATGHGTRSLDTWEYDGTTWIRAQPSTSPPFRSRYVLAWDAASQRIVMHGGGPGPTMISDETWEYDGVDWIQRSTNTNPRRYSHSMVYVDSRRHVLMFGGTDGSPGGGNGGQLYDETLVYERLSPADYVPFGTGCPGSNGLIPRLEATESHLPWLGDAFEVECRDLAATSSLALLLIGLSDTQWNGGILPMGLSSFGLPGCSLLVSPDAVAGAAPQNGNAGFLIPIPVSSALVGLSFFNQVVAEDLAAAGAATVSNGTAGLVGAR